MANITLSNNYLTAQIALNPFELTSLIFNDQEYIYQQTDGWQKSWPLCFPIVGKLWQNKYIYNHQEYHMHNHGIFRDISDWQIITQTATSLTVQYDNKISNFNNYPFEFSLNVNYSIENQKLINTFTLKNTDNNKLYYNFGWHPAFILDANSGTLTFNKNMKFYQVPLDGYLQAEMMTIENKIFLASKLDFNNGRSYIALDQTSSQVNLKDHSRHLIINYDNYNELVVWKNQNNSNYLCVEPWDGHQDYSEPLIQDITQKLWIKSLGSQEKTSYQLQVEFIK